jgi:hypothetical protein
MQFWLRFNPFRSKHSGPDHRSFSAGGSTIVEVIVGVAIAAVAIVGMTMLFTSGFDAYKISRGYTNGVYLAQEKLEEIPIANPPSVAISGKPAASIPAISNMGSEMLQDINYRWERKYYTDQEGAPAGFVQVEVQVNWADNEGNHKVSLVSLKQK